MTKTTNEQPQPTRRQLNRASPLMYRALNDMLDHYTRLVNSGDCGNWDCEDEPQVQQARAALALAQSVIEHK